MLLSGPCSRDIEWLLGLLLSAPKTLFPLELGPTDVGEGKTSVNLEGGSLRESGFHMPPPQGNEVDPEWPRPRDAPEDGTCEPQVPDSADGVVGCDVVGDIELLAKEPFLC